MLELLTQPWSYEFMVRAFAATIIVAVVCALLSCWLVLIGWSLMGDAISHAVLPGVVIAHIVGGPLALGALIFGVGAVLAIGQVNQRSKVKEDAAIGLIFTTFFALGLVLISVRPAQIDLQHIIMGNVLGVSAAGLAQIAVLSAIVIAVLFLKRRHFTLFAFDSTYAHALGLGIARLHFLLLFLLAITCVVALQVVGVVLVVAMLIIPGASAQLLTTSMKKMLLIAPLLAAGAAIAGMYLSYFLDTAAGPMVVLVQGACFAIIYGVKSVSMSQRRSGVITPSTG